MKKVIITTLLLCIGIAAHSQIQNKFWGLVLSECYTSLTQVKDLINDKCEYVNIEEDNISAFKGKFGGYDWKFIDFSFYKGYYSYMLYHVRFSSAFKEKSTAEDRFNGLKMSLQSKYSEMDVSNPEKYSFNWRDNESRHSCHLSMQLAESKGGELLWYVNLSYYDAGLLNKAVSEDEEEL